MMKTSMLILGLSFAYCSVNGQVGINTNDPKTTLHIVAKSTAGNTAEGLIAPNLTRAQVVAKSNAYGQDQKGAFVYISSVTAADPTSPKTSKIISTGYYYFDGAVWRRLSYNTEQIYLPSFNLPLPSITAEGDPSETYDLYTSVYKHQFTKLGNASFVSSNADLSIIPDLYPADQLDYVVTYFDPTIIKDVTISEAGVLSYKVVSTNPPNSSFINIVLVVK